MAIGRPPSPLPHPALLEQIVTNIKRGATAQTAALAAGVVRSTWAEWIRLGREGHERYAELATTIDRARAEFVLETLDRLSAAASPAEVKKLTWLLERRMPFDYAPERLVPEEKAPEGDALPPITIRIMGPGSGE